MLIVATQSGHMERSITQRISTQLICQRLSQVLHAQNLNAQLLLLLLLGASGLINQVNQAAEVDAGVVAHVHFAGAAAGVAVCAA